MNAAARLVVKKRKSDSITPSLRDTLHWLLVRERIQALSSRLQMSPPTCRTVPRVNDLSSFGSVNTGHLRSAGQGDLTVTVPRTRTAVCWLRLSVAGPSLWNTLPSDMKQSSLSIEQFCSQLKSVIVCPQLLRMSAAVIILSLN